MHRPRVADMHTHMRFAVSLSLTMASGARHPLSPLLLGVHRDRLMSTPGKPLKKAWWGAACMQSMLGMCIRPVMGTTYMSSSRGRAHRAS